MICFVFQQGVQRPVEDSTRQHLSGFGREYSRTDTKPDKHNGTAQKGPLKFVEKGGGFIIEIDKIPSTDGMGNSDSDNSVNHKPIEDTFGGGLPDWPGAKLTDTSKIRPPEGSK